MPLVGREKQLAEGFLVVLEGIMATAGHAGLLLLTCSSGLHDALKPVRGAKLVGAYPLLPPDGKG